ncbi:MAG: MGMT family protein [Flavobacteriales bacterium]|nr:MGMT family protein [Flavobacteriales bacterium]
MTEGTSVHAPTSRPGSGDFERDVHAVARLIPPGRVTSYGAIARYLGAARSSRMVGWAMNRALENGRNADEVPAHRVVNRHGLLTGRMHFPTPETMAERLRAEGVAVIDAQVVDFDTRYWDPSTEL